MVTRYGAAGLLGGLAPTGGANCPNGTYGKKREAAWLRDLVRFDISGDDGNHTVVIAAEVIKPLCKACTHSTRCNPNQNSTGVWRVRTGNREPQTEIGDRSVISVLDKVTRHRTVRVVINAISFYLVDWTSGCVE